LRITGTTSRDAFVTAVDAAGIGATRSYPLALCDVPEVVAQLRSPRDPMPGARLVASQIVTLPTHGHCPEGYEQRIRTVATTMPYSHSPGLSSAAS
jgi:hypothetical protein